MNNMCGQRSAEDYREERIRSIDVRMDKVNIEPSSD